MLFFFRTKPPLPDGYTIISWKDNSGNTRYSVYRGDDRLMSFASRAEAYDYAVAIHQQRLQGN